MGSTPLAAQASHAVVGNPQPDVLASLEPVQGPSGMWFLAVAGDPERFYAGHWGDERSAVKHRDWLIERRQRMPVPDVQVFTAKADAYRKAGDALANTVGQSVFNLTNILAHESGANHQAIATIRLWLANAVDDYCKAVDHG